jgi:murein DD-endopeptidase MepM/ murein hydrolase activator NlpD
VRRSRAAILLLSALALPGCFGPRTNVVVYNGHAHPSGPFLFPLKNAEVLSKFGERTFGFHTGLDLRATRGGGDPVLASRAGRVIQASVMKGYGRIVVIKHSDGFITRYAHLKSFAVSRGQEVKALQPIGVVGRSGRATTAHLHFEILTPSGRFTDPADYLISDDSAAARSTH